MSKLGSGFNLDITPTQVNAGLSLPIPSVAVGIVSIQNISLGFKLCVPFTGERSGSGSISAKEIIPSC